MRLPVGPVIRTGCSRPPQAGAGEGLPSCRAHLLPMPFPLPRRVPRRLHLQVFGAFHGLRRDFSGSALSCPLAGLASRGCRIRLMLRPGQSLPPKGLLTLGSDAGRFPPTPPACYRASWQLPGRDSHPLATTSLCWITIYISALQLWAHPRQVINSALLGCHSACLAGCRRSRSRSTGR